jgi:hypothetical protein
MQTSVYFLAKSTLAFLYAPVRTGGIQQKPSAVCQDQRYIWGLPAQVGIPAKLFREERSTKQCFSEGFGDFIVPGHLMASRG